MTWHQEDAETVILTVTSGTGYNVGSPSAATVTITDNDLPTVTVVATDANASESGSNTGSFTVSRTGPTTAALSVSYALTGTAGNGTDYSALSTTVLIGVGQGSATVTVTPTNDGAPEPAETVILTVSRQRPLRRRFARGGHRQHHRQRSADGDCGGNRCECFRVGVQQWKFHRYANRSHRRRPLRQLHHDGNGRQRHRLLRSVDHGSDPRRTAVRQRSRWFPSMTASMEPTETVILTVSANALYGIGSPSAATVNITDNDLPTVNVNATDDSAAEAGLATGTFTITRGGDLTSPLTVNYTIGGSATNGSDYATLSGSVVIAAGSASATVVVTPADDGLDETNETVVLTLAAGAGYQVGSSNDDTVTIADNDGTTPNPQQPGNGNNQTAKDQCKNGGWRTLGDFKNQGDCVSWFATGGKNPPAGSAPEQASLEQTAPEQTDST